MFGEKQGIWHVSTLKQNFCKTYMYEYLENIKYFMSVKISTFVFQITCYLKTDAFYTNLWHVSDI